LPSSENGGSNSGVKLSSAIIAIIVVIVIVIGICIVALISSFRRGYRKGFSAGEIAVNEQLLEPTTTTIRKEVALLSFLTQKVSNIFGNSDWRNIILPIMRNLNFSPPLTLRNRPRH